MVVGISLLLSINTEGQAQVICTSKMNGIWNDPNIWDCGGSNCVPGALDDVIIHHTITTTFGESARSVYIENSENGVAANLIHEASGKTLTIGTGGLTIDATNDLGAISEFATTGDAITIINGDVLIRKANVSLGSSARFRVGGANIASIGASVTINGNLEVRYFNSNNGSYEDQHEINVGFKTGDNVMLVVNGQTTLTYNFNNTSPYNQLAFETANNSSVILNGNLNLIMTDGGTQGKVRFTLLDNATATINGDANLTYNDDDTGTKAYLQLGQNATDPNSANLIIKGNLNLISNPATTFTTPHNVVYAYMNSKLEVDGNINFTSAGGGSYNKPSIQNRLEFYNSAALDILGNFKSPDQGSLYFDANSKIIFSGSVQQTIPVNLRTAASSTQTGFQNLEINNTSGLPVVIADKIRAASDGIIVDKILNLKSGIVNSVSPSNIVKLTNDATMSGGSISSYIEGPVFKTCSGSACGNTIFLVGNNNYFAPLDISNISGENNTTIFEVQYHKSGYPVTALQDPVTYDHISGLEYWTANVAGTVPSVSLTLFWEDACFSQINSVVGGAGQDLFIGHFDGTDWDVLPSTISGSSEACGGVTSKGSVTATANTFSPFTFVSKYGNNPLPIQLVNFEVSKDKTNEVTISWQTGSEFNNDFFTIERRLMADNWVSIDTVPAKNSPSRYETSDYPVRPGIYYYRLRQHDLDGTTTHSEVRSIKLDNLASAFSIFPNPASSKLTITSEFSLNGAVVDFIMSDGSSFRTFKLDNSGKSAELDISTFPNGMYMVSLHLSGTKTQKKVIIWNP